MASPEMQYWPMLSRSICVGSDLAEVPELAKQLKAAWLSMGLPQALTVPLELCVVEAVNNAIEHAYGGQRGHQVNVVTTLRGATLITQVCDQGKALDTGRLRRASTPEFTDPEAEVLPERGMGLAIMKQVMDDVTYESCGGENTLTLTKVIAETAAGSAESGS